MASGQPVLTEHQGGRHHPVVLQPAAEGLGIPDHPRGVERGLEQAGHLRVGPGEAPQAPLAAPGRPEALGQLRRLHAADRAVPAVAALT